MFENVFKLLKIKKNLYIFDTREGGGGGRGSTTRFLGNTKETRGTKLSLDSMQRLHKLIEAQKNFLKYYEMYMNVHPKIGLRILRRKPNPTQRQGRVGKSFAWTEPTYIFVAFNDKTTKVIYYLKK